MYLDKQNLFSDKQAVTVTTAASNTLDLGIGDIGPACEGALGVFGGPCTGSGTMVVELRTADAVDGSGNLVSPTTIATYPVSNATLLSGGRLAASVLPYGMKRYAGLNYIVSGTVAGAVVTSGVVLNV